MPRTTTQRSISLDPAVLEKGAKRAKQRGFGNSFSAYVNRLIEEDDDRLTKQKAPGAPVMAGAHEDNGR